MFFQSRFSRPELVLQSFKQSCIKLVHEVPMGGILVCQTKLLCGLGKEINHWKYFSYVKVSLVFVC